LARVEPGPGNQGQAGRLTLHKETFGSVLI
jgi:hypothetical protein